MKRSFILLCLTALLLSALSPAAAAVSESTTAPEVRKDQTGQVSSYDSFFSVDSIFYEDSAALNNVLSHDASIGKSPFREINGDCYYQNDLVSSYVGNDKVIFFSAGDAIYRHHVSSGTTDIVLKKPKEPLI